MLGNYKNLFAENLGHILNIQAKINIQPTAKPVFIRARTVQFAVREAVERELDELEKNGILVKVNSSKWATPIVPIPKLEGKVRICGDYKITVNPNLIVDEHPLPKIEELFSSMAGGNF